jgi:hypothetical protein
MFAQEGQESSIRPEAAHMSEESELANMIGELEKLDKSSKSKSESKTLRRFQNEFSAI